MPLSAAQQEQFKNWLAAKQVSSTCPACGATNQWVGAQAVATPRMEADGVHIDSQTPPLVQVICRQCAYVLLFAALPIGLQIRKGSASEPTPT